MADDERQARFATTNWSLVARAVDLDPAVRRDALAHLLAAYCPALRAFLVRRLNVDPTSADDLVQGFVADKLLAQNLLERLDRQRGKLRSLLMKSLERYAFDDLRRRRAEGRRLERLAGMIDDDPRESDAFAREWARQVLRLALDQARAECRDRRRRAEWQLLEARVVRPALLGVAPVAYEALLPELAFRDVKQAENALVTAKRRLRRAIQRVIGQYAAPEDVDAEIADLMRAVGQAAPEADDGLPPLRGDELESSSHAGLAMLLDCEAEDRDCDERLALALDQALQQELAPTASTQTIVQALDAARPRVDALRAIRRWVRAESSAYPPAVVEVVEALALATALVTCGEMLTRAPRSTLAERLARAAGLPWVPPPRRELLGIAAALAAC